MIQLKVHYLRFGNWLLKRTGGDTFEVMRLGGEGQATAIARVGIGGEAMPTLNIERLAREPRLIDRKPLPASDRVLLTDCRQGDPDCFRLTAEAAGDELKIILSGDSRREAGRHKYRLFWWGAEFSASNGEVTIHGPTLASDPWS